MRLGLVGCVVLGWLAALPAQAQDIVIDSFDTNQACGSLVSTGASCATNTDVASGTILQTERNLQAVAGTIGPGGEVDLDVANSTAGNLHFVRTNNATASIEAWWDGNNNTNTLDNAVGLGGIDITAGAQDRFRITVTTSSSAQQMRLTVWSSPTSASQADFALAVGTTDVMYASFVQSTAGGVTSSASFNSVRAIDLATTATTGAVWTADIDELRTHPVELLSVAVD